MELDIKTWIKCGITNKLNIFKDTISKDEYNTLLKRINETNDMDKLNIMFSRFNAIAFFYEDEKRSELKKYYEKHKFCPRCKKDLLNINFRYNKRYLTIDGSVKKEFKKFHLQPYDLCYFCYIDKCEDELLNNDTNAKSSLRRQGVKSPTKEMIRTKKLTLLIKKEIKKQKG